MKKIGLICITALACISLTACSSSSSHKSSASSSSSSKVVKKHHKKKQNKKKQTESSSVSQQTATSSQQQTQVSQTTQNSNSQPNTREHSNEDVPSLVIKMGDKGNTAYEYHTQGMPTQADVDSASRTAESLNQAGVYGNVNW